VIRVTASDGNSPFLCYCTASLRWALHWLRLSCLGSVLYIKLLSAGNPLSFQPRRVHPFIQMDGTTVTSNIQHAAEAHFVPFPRARSDGDLNRHISAPTSSGGINDLSPRSSDPGVFEMYFLTLTCLYEQGITTDPLSNQSPSKCRCFWGYVY
jgi:hypothetical protein